MILNALPKEVKRVLITGGGGFIGGALIRKLLLNTNVEVYNLDKLSYSSDLTSINLILSKNNSFKKKYHFLKSDLNNKSEIIEAFQFSDPDIVFHLAAESHVDRSIDSPDDFIKSNIVGTYNLLEASRKHLKKLSYSRKQFFKFHHISTDEVFGSLEIDSQSFSEETPYSPRSPYSATKAASDHLVNAWYHTYGLPIVITNCSNNYGPWQFPEKFIPLVILKAINLKEIPIYGKGENIRDWLYVDDHVDALIKVAANANPGSKYCISGSQEYTNNEVVTLICGLLDDIYPAEISYSNLISYVEDRPGHDFRYAINAEKIKKELYWSPKNNFIDGLKYTVNWYLNNLEWCNKLRNNTGYSGQRLGNKK